MIHHISDSVQQNTMDAIHSIEAHLDQLIALSEIKDTDFTLVSKEFFVLLKVVGSIVDQESEKVTSCLTKLLTTIDIYVRSNTTKGKSFDQVVAALAMTTWSVFAHGTKGSKSTLNQLFMPVPAKDTSDNVHECTFSQCWHSIAKYETNIMPLVSMKSFANAALVNQVGNDLSYSFLYFVMAEYHRALEFADYLRLEINRIESPERLSKFTTILEYTWSSVPRGELLGVLTCDMVDVYSSTVKNTPTTGFKKLDQKLATDIFHALTPILFHTKDYAPGDLTELSELNQAKTSDRSASSIAFNFLLEVIDQHENLDYFLDSALVQKLLLALCVLNKQLDLGGKLQFFLLYNKLNSKISLTVCLLCYNYLIQRNLLKFAGSNDDIPGLVAKNFDFLNLPPLSKSDRLCAVEPASDSFGNDIRLINQHSCFHNLLYCCILNLNLLTKVINDEFVALSTMSDNASDEIIQKLVFSLLDLTFSCLFPVLVVLLKVDDWYLRPTGTKLVYEVFKTLLNIDTSIEASLIWVNFLNFAHDVCYSDIRFYQIFEQLFAYLIQQSAEVKEDPLIRSGLESFVLTFTDGESKDSLCELLAIRQERSPSKQISLDDLRYLYPQKSGGDEQLKDTNLETKLNSGKPGNSSSANKSYLVNSARKPSVHIDQFGK